MNKLGERRDNGAALIFIFLVAVAILLLILLFKILVIAGIVIALIGIILFFYGFSDSDETIAIIGVVAFVIGIGLLFVGLAGLSFFNGPGKPLADGSSAVVDSGFKAAEAANQAKEAGSNAEKQVYDSLGNAIPKAQ